MPGAFQGLLCSEEILWRIYFMKILDIYVCSEHIICCWGCLYLSRCNHSFFTISVFLTPDLSNSLVWKFSVPFTTVVTFFQTLFSRLFVASQVLQSRLLCASAPYPVFLTCMDVNFATADRVLLSLWCAPNTGLVIPHLFKDLLFHWWDPKVVETGVFHFVIPVILLGSKNLSLRPISLFFLGETLRKALGISILSLVLMCFLNRESSQFIQVVLTEE